MCWYQGQLIVGGDMPGLGNIAVFNGESWMPLNDGLDQPPIALIVYRGKLIATGAIKRAGNVKVSAIAAWDGSLWSKLGRGLYNSL